MGRSNIEGREWIDAIRKQRIDLETLGKIIVLYNGTQEESTRELIVGSYAQNIAAEEVGACIKIF